MHIQGNGKNLYENITFFLHKSAKTINERDWIATENISENSFFMPTERSGRKKQTTISYSR